MATHATDGLMGVSVADLQWFSGYWAGFHGDDAIDECWSPLSGDTIMGMFRWRRNGITRFYEFIALEPHDNQVEMRFKHLNRGMVSWEEKEEYQRCVLVELCENEAVFFHANHTETQWLVYHATGPDTLTVYFDKSDADVPEQDKFIYQRKALP